MPLKGISKKVYIGIILIVLLVALAVAMVSFVYNNQQTANSVSVKVGVKVGDTFDYKLTGSSTLYSQSASTPAYLSQYNDTDYYRITITGINGTIVSFTTDWKFLNGTDQQQSQWVNVSSGDQSDPNGFWGIYSSNLKVGDPTRPGGYDGINVNGTTTQTYSSSSRVSDHFSVSNEFYDVNDPTHSTYRDEFDDIYFDQQTGMLTTLTNVQQYNNPQMTLVITWKLSSSSVWAV